jgi:hypothetical protein
MAGDNLRRDNVLDAYQNEDSMVGQGKQGSGVMH